ncbi:Ssr2 [Scenedesmus sp. PABB004]|nr:Ssr2 [Scenedesmus sp. PABB004]
MAAWKSLLLLALLAGAAVVRAEEAEAEAAPAAEEAEDDEDYDSATDRAHLVVRKWFKEELGVQGRNLTVHLEAYNAGSAAASDVQLEDAPVPKGLRLIEGALEASLGKIDVGGSAQHSYTLVADDGAFAAEFAPATVTYVAEFESKEKQSTKSSAYGIYIMTPREQITRYALIAGSYASLGMATTTAHWRNIAIVLGLVLAGVTGNNTYKSVNAKSSERRRTKALAELEKEQ